MIRTLTCIVVCVVPADIVGDVVLGAEAEEGADPKVCLN